MEKILHVAIAGNPNAGKTTIFNDLTGARQHVGNYPGVTVEKKFGRRTYKGYRLEIVDLPGTYTLSAHSEEEVIARDYLIHERPDVVIDVVDASNLERNLYLTVQLLELNCPLVIALNMADALPKRGLSIDTRRLSEFFGAPMVFTVGHKRKGIDELLDAVINVGEHPETVKHVEISYGKETDPLLDDLARMIEERVPHLCQEYPARWLALKLLERDELVAEIVRKQGDAGKSILEKAGSSASHIERIYGDSSQIVIADQRYGFISGACQEAVRSTVDIRHTYSDKIDLFVTNPILGLPLFLAIMYLVFYLTFQVGEVPMHWLEALFDWMATGVGPLLPEGAVRSLWVDGLIRGVGGVIVFLPNILLLFLGIALLEDSGYMARAAFVTDNLMHRIGLHGKSFVPMLIGFGCTVPAILATRTLDSRRDRFTTIMVLPLISCGARFPIYTLIIPAFFPAEWRAPILWLIYLIGIVLAVLLARILRKTLFRGETMPFVMELPPYRLPTLLGALIHTWERGWLYLRKAGTVILLISIGMWFLTNYPKPDPSETASLPPAKAKEYEIEHSVAGRIGHFLEPVTRPLGFDWRINTALIGAFAAKEVFVAQMGIVHALGETGKGSPDLRARLREQYTPLTGFCIMLFCLIGTPCMATLAVTRQEMGSFGWAVLQFSGLTALAYVITLVVYQVCSLFGIGIA